MEVDSEEWKIPEIHGGLDGFELCRAIKEKGRVTGRYETLKGSATVKESVVNWEHVFVQFRDENGESIITAFCYFSLVVTSKIYMMNRQTLCLSM